jgi:hypothetical protein
MTWNVKDEGLSNVTDEMFGFPGLWYPSRSGRNGLPPKATSAESLLHTCVQPSLMASGSPGCHGILYNDSLYSLVFSRSI